MNVWIPCGALAVTALLITFQATAQIYQWTDEDGNVHFSDELPAHQRDNADSVELSGTAPSQADVEAAQTIAENIHEAAESTAEGNRSREEKPEEPQEEQPTSNTTGKLELPPLPPLPDNATPAERDAHYEQAMERYQRAHDCFAPYKNANGSTKAEAFDVCPVVPRPRESDY
ncbi:DUF4124 domain-containing protein [Marinobacter sp. LN3S78]|uniref:DUF4124 domain-containing protein n=1 Tax=Marinobacter sp. LN3S78 TaxID=3382300 RepID=UPI00387AF6F1